MNLDLEPPELPPIADSSTWFLKEPGPGKPPIKPFATVEMLRELACPSPRRTCDEDGTHHFSHVKHLADSGEQYIEAVNTPRKPNPAMLIGTAVHALILGPRKGAPPIVHYPGKARRGKAWDAFELANDGAEILTDPEWERANEIAARVLSHPVARPFLEGARFEVPLTWEDSGILCSTSGVDIIPPNGMAGDLKSTTTVRPETLMRQCFRMNYHTQLAWYRRGCRANGIEVPNGLFLLCVEIKRPYEVVVLELAEELIDLAERTLSLWIEKLKVFKNSDQWPGYAQVPVVWTVPAWMRDDDGGDNE